MTHIGNRDQRIRQAALAGALGGAMWSVPISCLLALPYLFDTGAPATLRWEYIGHILLWTNLCWISIACAANASRAREATMSEEHQRVIQRYVLWAALESSIFAVPVAGFALITTWGYGPIGAVFTALTILSIWIGSACGVGHFRGVAEVRRQEQLQQSILVNQSRLELLQTLETRFGPVDEPRRSAIFAWNHDKLTEMRRRLESAQSLDDLDD